MPIGINKAAIARELAERAKAGDQVAVEAVLRVAVVEGDSERLESAGGSTREGRPIYKNQYGDLVTERTITENIPELGGWVNLPTVYDGRFVSPSQAIVKIIESGGVDPVTGREINSFPTVDEAVSAAESRSYELGLELSKGNEFRRQDKSSMPSSYMKPDTVPPDKAYEATGSPAAAAATKTAFGLF